MPIITLTSDLGHHSHYAAVLKGIILSLNPTATIIDVTHDIPNFDIMEAAYVVKNTFSAFPDGSIHVVAVDPDARKTPLGIVMKYRNQYFVAPDNGVVSLINEGQDAEYVEINNEAFIDQRYPKSFRAARVFAPIAAFLSKGTSLEEIGPTNKIKDLFWGDPIYSKNCLRGKIIHIDKFGNAVTNIHRGEFMKRKSSRPFEIFIRSVRLKRIVSTYSDVSKGEPLAIFGDGNYLEVAMRETSAAGLLGLKIHDMITIEFK